MTPLKLQLEGFREDARLGKQKYPDLRGSMIVGIAKAGWNDDPNSLPPMIPTWIDELTPFDPPEQVAITPLGDNIHFVFAGRRAGYEDFVRLSRAMYDAKLTYPGLGTLTGDDRLLAPYALLGHLIGASGLKVEGIPLQTVIYPFECPGWEPSKLPWAIQGADGLNPDGKCFHQVLRQPLFAAVESLIYTVLAEPSPNELTPEEIVSTNHTKSTSLDRAIRSPRIKRLSDEALDLDREYPFIQGAVVVARRGPGACIPTPLADSIKRAKPSPNGFYPFYIYNTQLGGKPDNPSAPLTPILANLTGDDLGVAYIGHGHGKYVELAGRVADLGLDIAGLGRFGDLQRDQRPEAPDRLLAFLAAFASRRINGITIRADLDPFADEGFGPVPSNRAAILDPRGEARDSPFVVIIRQGLFAALGELLALASLSSEGKTQEPLAGHRERSTRPRVESVNPGSKAISAAYQLAKEGRRVSLAAACKLAGVDRKHVSKQYPEAVTTIRMIAAPDREVRRGNIDYRTGNVDGVSDADE